MNGHQSKDILYLMLSNWEKSVERKTYLLKTCPKMANNDLIAFLYQNGELNKRIKLFYSSEK